MNRLHRKIEIALYDRRCVSDAIACFCQSLQDVCRILNEGEGKKCPPKKPKPRK